MNRLTAYAGAALLLVGVAGGLVFVRATTGISEVFAPSAGSPAREESRPSLYTASSARAGSVAEPAPTPATSAKTSAAKRSPASSKNNFSSAASPATAPVSPAAATETPRASLADASASLRAALVNIMCYAPAGSALHSISGSGVVIDPKGVILTNAHVAQYFLLADQGVSCVIRSGSPATDEYQASLEYISPAWIQANAGILSENMPSGTGEHDYALLAITGSASSAPLPAQFPSIALALAPPASGTPVVIASYGAQFLNTAQIQSHLSPTVVYGSVKGIYTFGTSTVDVLALGGSAAAQEGSSGGGVASARGRLVGVITTSTVTGPTYDRSLNAITASYIQADYLNESGAPIEQLLAQRPADAAAQFAPRIPALEATVMSALGGP